ncbi:unnamed protein product [Moneuplotes crassus]|uniref:Uncharacterized protein n=1 Tax=Euplotes crassus TaxID=5936 RepID=A0AAD1UMK6_EUPCR|nr:unnamed protein product [Moneuplotes crassus]
MQPILKLSKTYSKETKDIWDDSDMQISEEISDCKTLRPLNHTKQFCNTLKNNKGKIKDEDLFDFARGNIILLQQKSLKHSQIECGNKEVQKTQNSKEPRKYIANPTRATRYLKSSSSALREGTKIMSDLRRVPSFELLKEIH